MCFSTRSFKTGLSKTGELGFSVLEAMVAMALLAAAFLPILSLQSQFVRTVNSLERADRGLEVRHVALNKIKTINPAKNPTGEYEHLESQVKWVAQPVFPLQTLYEGGSPSSNDVTLYDINVEIYFLDGSFDQFKVRRLGWVLRENTQSLFE